VVPTFGTAIFVTLSEEVEMDLPKIEAQLRELEERGTDPATLAVFERRLAQLRELEKESAEIDRRLKKAVADLKKTR